MQEPVTLLQPEGPTPAAGVSSVLPPDLLETGERESAHAGPSGGDHAQ
jgi:hypothetical protein